jgi:hypothetical protein
MRKKGSPQLDANELARDKFNALFAAHDAKDEREATQQQMPELNSGEKALPKKVKREKRESDNKSDSRP